MAEDKADQRAVQRESGLGVDSFGDPVVDPTKNVLQLVEAAVSRLDDLSVLRQKFLMEKVADLKEYFKDVQKMRADHNKELREAESSRLDSIRQVDRAEADKTSTASQNAIQALAAQTLTLAETLRIQVATTASAAAEQLASVTNTIGNRLSALERAQAEGTGKQTIVDPQIAALINEMRQVNGTQSRDKGKASGVTMMIAIAVAASSVVAVIISIVGTGGG